MAERSLEVIQLYATYIIEGYTIDETAEKFGCSRSTIQKCIRELGNQKSKFYQPVLFDKMRLAQKKESLLRVKKGGQMGKRGSTITEAMAKIYADIIILQGLTLEEASAFFKIPSSTLYDSIRSIPDVKIQNKLDVTFAFNLARRGNKTDKTVASTMNFVNYLENDSAELGKNR